MSIIIDNITTLTGVVYNDTVLDEVYYNNVLVFRNNVTVTFDGNGGTATETSREVRRGSAIENMPTASKLGYNFNGWYTAATGGDLVTSETIITENITLYAQYSAAYLTMELLNTHVSTGTYVVVNDYTMGGDGTLWQLYWLNQTGNTVKFSITYTVTRTKYNYFEHDQGGICVNDKDADYDIMNQYNGLVSSLDCTDAEQTKSLTVEVTVDNNHILHLWNNNHATTTWSVQYM